MNISIERYSTDKEPRIDHSRSGRKSGYRNFANRTLASGTFATGENPGVYWWNSTALSPIGEIPKDVLAKVRWTFASCDGSILTQNTYESNSQSNWPNSSRDVGESLIGENLIGESRNPPKINWSDN